MSVKFGTVSLKHGLMLAPMAGVTDRTFRLLCRRFGAEYTVSEMVSAKALCYEQTGRKKEAASGGSGALAAVAAEEMPMAVQLFGREPAFMAEAARMLEANAYRGCVSASPPSAIDINMGCPVRKITANGEGSALMREPELAGQIVEAVCRAVSLPVTVKIRAGWDSLSVNAPEFAKVLEQAGASLICVHARTREELYTPGIRTEVIRAVKQAVRIPVIGNGDLCSADDVIRMREQTECDGVMIGRAAMGDPWLFAEITAALEGREWTPPRAAERLAVAEEQLDRMIAHKGERNGLAESKKHMARYLTGLRGAAAARSAVMTARTAEEIRAVFAALAENAENGGREDGGER